MKSAILHLFQPLLYIHSLSRKYIRLDPTTSGQKSHWLSPFINCWESHFHQQRHWSWLRPLLQISWAAFNRGRGAAIIPGPPYLVNLTQQNFELQEMSSPRLESHRFHSPYPRSSGFSSIKTSQIVVMPWLDSRVLKWLFLSVPSGFIVVFWRRVCQSLH